MAANGCEAALDSDLANCGACGNACSAPSGGTASCDMGHCAFTAPAAGVELWNTSVSGTQLSIWADGTLYVTGGASAAAVDPTTGAASSRAQPGGRASIWIDGTGTSQNANGGGTDRRGYQEDGTLDWEWLSLGCCNDNGNMPIDVGGIGYTTQAGALYAVDLSSGAGSSVATGGTDGRDSILGSRCWVAGFDGRVSLYDTGGSAMPITVSVDPGGGETNPRFFPGAIMTDGSFVVASATKLARIATDGTVAWSVSTPLTTGPIVANGSGSSLIVVGTPTGLAAYHTDGTPQGSLPTPSAVGDVLAADGMLYLLLAGGEVVGFDTATNAFAETYTGLPTSGEMLLRDGVLYVVGGGTLHALPVSSSGYDPMSPWPVRLHDNQRTANGMAPLTY